MAAILDLGQNEDLPWVDTGELSFLFFFHTSNEFISGEKPLLTFLSNLSCLLLMWYISSFLILSYCDKADLVGYIYSVCSLH